MTGSASRCANAACPSKPIIEGEDDRTPYDDRKPCPVCGSKMRSFARAVSESAPAVDMTARATLTVGATTARAAAVSMHASSTLTVAADVVPAPRLTLSGLPVTHELVVLFADLSEELDPACVIEIQTPNGEHLVSGVGDTPADALAALFENMLPPSSSERIDPADDLPDTDN